MVSVNQVNVSVHATLHLVCSKKDASPRWRLFAIGGQVNSVEMFVGIALKLSVIFFVKLMKDFTDIYGILYNCPVGERCQDCPINEAALSFFQRQSTVL